MFRLAVRRLLGAALALTAMLGDARAYSPNAVEALPAACGGTSLATELARRAPERLQAAFARAAQTANSEGLFWRIERRGVRPSYLFGTIRSTDPRALDVPKAVRQALANAGIVALELAEVASDSGGKMMAERTLDAAFAPEGDTLAFITDPMIRGRLEAIIGAYGIPADAAHRLRPWFLTTLLGMPPCESARRTTGFRAVDQLIAEDRPESARVVGLETPDEHFALISGLDEDVLHRSLLASLQHAERQLDIYATEVDMYLQRRVVATMEVLAESGVFKASELKAFVQLQNQLRGDREAAMVERVLPYVKRGNTFVAVGALHLAGESGMVERFRRAGFTVTRIW